MVMTTVQESTVEWTEEGLVNQLSRMPEFERLKKSLLTDLAKIAKRELYPCGTTILCEQEPVNGFYLIESGSVKIIRNAASDHKHIVDFFHDRESFNLVPTLDKGVNPATVVSLLDTTIWHFPMAALRPLMARNPRLIEVFARLAAQHTRDLIMMSEELASLPVKERLARFLLRNLDGLQDVVHQFFTDDELANHLGTESDVIGRELDKLQSEGIIKIESNQIVIQDKFTLQKIAHALAL